MVNKMTNDQMTIDCSAASSALALCLVRRRSPQRPKAGASFDIRHWCRVISWMLIFQTCCAAWGQAQSPSLIGKWNVEITFANNDHRSLRFDAQSAGKGTFLLLDPRLKVWGHAKPSEANWSPAEGNSVSFSGPVEFLLGNVGRDPGTLVFRGKFETADLITGEVEFSPLVGERPSKHGTFKAIRAAE
jgi:hypothetical protein